MNVERIRLKWRNPYSHLHPDEGDTPIVGSTPDATDEGKREGNKTTNDDAAEGDEKEKPPPNPLPRAPSSVEHRLDVIV